MVMEQDNRLRGQYHLAQSGPMVPQHWPPPQQPWGVALQQQQAFGMPLMQPGGALFAGHVPVHMPGVMFHPGPVFLQLNGAPPQHQMVPMQQGHHHHPAFAAQPFMQQDQMPLMRRVRHAAPTQQGQLPRPAAQPGNGARQPPAQPAPPGVLQQQQPAPVPARASAAGSRPAATKSAGGQARPGNAHAQVAAGSKSKLPRTAASGAPAAAAALEKAPSSESDADWAVLHDLKLGDGPSCWADLVDGILQQVVDCIKDNGATMAAFRATCTNWRKAADSTMDWLSPKAMWPKDLLRLFSKLQHLQLESCRNVRNRDLFVLANTPVSPAGVEPPQFLGLTSLVLGDDQNKPWVTNRGLESIGTMRNLRFLALHDCNSVTNKGIEALSVLTTLDCLSLRGCRKLTNHCTGTLAVLTRLTRLNLYGCRRLSDAGMAALERLPLVALSMGHTRVRDDGMKSLAKLTSLTELHFVREDIRIEGLKHLSTLKQLHVLAMRDLRVTNQHLQALLSLLPSVRDLSVSRSTDVNGVIFVNNISLFDNMTALDLRETGMNDVGLSACTSLLELRVLKIRPSIPFGVITAPIIDLAEVSQLTQLTSLSMPLPKLRTTVLQSIGRLTGLRELDLSKGYTGPHMPLHDDTLLDASVYAEIAKLTGLTSLDLSRRLAHPQPPNEKLDKRLQPLQALQGPSGARQMANLMRQLPRLQRINLASTNISDTNINRLERMFPLVTVVGGKVGTESSSDLANWCVTGTLSAL